MKKSLSVIMALAMLVCSLSFSVNAFAATKAKAPERALGESFSVTLKGVSIDDEQAAKNAYICKFAPTESGYYEFVFDTPYAPAVDPSVDASFSMAATFITDENDEYLGIGMAASVDGKVDTEESPYPSVCGNLKAGKTYYLVAASYSYGSYTSNVVINKHTHHYYDDIFASTVEQDLKNNESGMYYTACDRNGCVYYKKTKTIRKVKSITLSASVLTYNGKERKPTVTVKDSKGNKISKKNYTVKYSNNKNVGIAKVKITFKNEYEGTYAAKFKINPKGTEAKSVSAKSKGFTVKWAKQATQTSGYQVQYATNSKFTNNKKTVTVKGTKTSSKTVTGLKAKKKYYVRVRTYKTVNGTKYYSPWSKAKTVTTKS
ncbi:MAG: fibronectin type III domain-containing protein [Ruminococcaceae bacterium]|nr:fibronectin type III domain-containing protein [Oscillospiraceae bacterium]